MKVIFLILVTILTILSANVYSQSETFSKFTYGTNTVPSKNDTSSHLDNCMMMNGWTGKRVFSAGGAAFVESGYLITPVLNLSTNTTITFYSWTNHSADQLIVDMTTNNGVNWINFTNISVNKTKTLYTANITGGTSTSKVRISSKVQDTTLQNYDDFLIDDITINNVPLPVKIESFNYLVTENNVELIWKTSDEVNNKGFQIYRNDDLIGWIDHNENHNYRFNDYNLQSGLYSYKLKQIDYNSNYEWFMLSSTVIINNPKKSNIEQNYPNPFNPTTKINYTINNDGWVSIKIFDINGKQITTLVNEYKKVGYYSIDFNGNNISSGMYYYRFETKGNVITKKMILIK